MNFTILRFNSLDSTNLEALRQAKQGANEGLCIVAEAQTAGRGRHGRNWISGKKAGLYCSFLLRPKLENKFLPLITLMSAIAVFDVLKELYNLQPDIKWANDVLINDKKICGILAEMSETTRGLAIVVGIGINLKSTNFPTEIAEIATSIEQETQKMPNANELLEHLTKQLAKYYQIIESENGAAQIRNEWAKRSSYCSGKIVRVKMTGEIIDGTTCGIEENGALRIQTETGEIKIIHAGEVEKLRTV